MSDKSKGKLSPYNNYMSHTSQNVKKYQLQKRDIWHYVNWCSSDIYDMYDVSIYIGQI